MDRSLAGYTVHRVTESDTTEPLILLTHTCVTESFCCTMEMRQHCESTIFQLKNKIKI